MESVEQVKKGRIKRAFRRDEIFHRFVHSPEYAYTNSGYTNRITACGNLLIVGHKEESTFEYIKSAFNVYNDCVIALINRDIKNIIINTSSYDYASSVIAALPDDYDVWYTDRSIPNYNILLEENKEELYKCYAKYLTNHFAFGLYEFYKILNGGRLLHNDYNKVFEAKYSVKKLVYLKKYADYKSIKYFVSKYKIKKYDWYKNGVLEKLNIGYTNSINIVPPTLKQIIDKKIFNKKQIAVFERAKFYTDYCYGRSISNKELDKYYNKGVDLVDFIRFCRSKDLYVSEDWFKTDIIDFNEGLIKAVEADQKYRKKYIEDNIKKSKKNRAEALGNYNLEDVLSNWRKGNVSYNQKVVRYRRYIIPKSKYSYGEWKEACEYISLYHYFQNVYLKLIDNNKTIITSRNASVPFEAGKLMFKLFIKTLKDNPNEVNFNFADKNYKVGIYNLRHIKYITKTHDNGNPLDYKDWLIQIGCHNIWLEEVIEFIQYYNLEKEFGVENIDNFKQFIYGRN